MEDNSHAGQGAVVLDIGGDVGALVLMMPKALAGVEIEARPVGREPADHRHGPGHDHGSGPGQGHSHGGAHDHSHDHAHGGAGQPGHLEHVAVVARPTPSGDRVHSAVFGALRAGTYELYQRPAGPVRLTVEVHGGTVATAIWP